MSLLIRGFDKQSIASASEIAEVIKALPARHVGGLKSIIYMSYKDFAALHLPLDSHCKGAFYPEFRSIVIHDLVCKELYRHIVLHEMGHYVFHAVIGSELKKKWYHEVSIACGHVTEYASRNKLEDFAECYAKYAECKQELLQYMEKYRFMKRQVFRV